MVSASDLSDPTTPVHIDLAYLLAGAGYINRRHIPSFGNEPACP